MKRKSYVAATGIFFLLCAVFLKPSHADALSLSVPQYFDILPINGTMDCRFVSNPEYGYLFNRTSEVDVSMEVIVKGLSEGEKSRAFSKIDLDLQLFTFVYLRFFSRDGDFGKYTEFRVDTTLNPNTLQIMGNMMFTESTYQRDAAGKEKEKFHPISKTPIVCKTL